MNLKVEKINKKSKKLHFWKFWKFSNFFENFSDFQLIVFSRLFELSWRSSSQKTSSWLQQSNGVHQKFARSLVRALRAKEDTPWYYSVQEKMFFEGITTPKVCVEIELSRREWMSVLLLVIFDDFGMILSFPIKIRAKVGWSNVFEKHLFLNRVVYKHILQPSKPFFISSWN